MQKDPFNYSNPVVLSGGLPYYDSIVVEVVGTNQLTPFLPSFLPSNLLSCKKRFKTPAMNADDPTRCPNIWISRHVQLEREESILAKGPTSTRREAFMVTSMLREISRASVRKCTLANVEKYVKVEGNKTCKMRGHQREREREGECVCVLRDAIGQVSEYTIFLRFRKSSRLIRAETCGRTFVNLLDERYRTKNNN